MCSITELPPHVRSYIHVPGRMPHQLARVASNNPTNTLPTSALTQRSNISHITFPNPMELTDHGAIIAPSSIGSTIQGLRPFIGLPLESVLYFTCSITGMNCMYRLPSDFRKRYISFPFPSLARFMVVIVLKGTPPSLRHSIPLTTLPKTEPSPLSFRYLSCISSGPSMETPTRKPFSLKKSAHSLSSRTPLVWTVLYTVLPAAYFFSNSTAFL